MADEVLAQLQPRAGGLYIDATFGAGGHTRRLLDAEPTLRVIALDRDADAHQLAVGLQQQPAYTDRLIPLHGRFSQLPALLSDCGIQPNSVDGILFDFGCSSMQFDRPERGFSISHNGPLDMRMDRSKASTAAEPCAADVLARIDELDLARILKVYGEERNAKKIARAICDMRYALRRLQTTRELAELVASCFPSDGTNSDKLGRPAHLATKTFQALRIFVNDELNEINYAMLVAGHYVRRGGVGRLVTLTFHSLEDTIVKRHLMGHLLGGGQTANPVPLKYCAHGAVVTQDERDVRTLMASQWQQLHRHVMVPSEAEVDRNPRARSAKLRAAERL